MILQEARSFTACTFAESTKSSYRTHLRAYLRFCLYFNLDPVPATQMTLILYTAYLGRSLKPASVSNYLNIVRILHLEAGLQNPMENNFALTNLKRGMARQLGTPPKQMLPFTVEMLVKIKSTL